MAQVTATGTLATVPSIMNQLVTEPRVEDDQEPVLNSMSMEVPYLGGVFNAGVGQLVNAIGGANPPASIMAFRSAAEIVQAVRAGTRAIPLDQIARLGVNSNEFYCIIGAKAQAAAPAHVIATQAHSVQSDFPSLWYVNFPHIMSGHDVELVRRSRKSMADFRSWSSKKWWEEVARRFGVADDAIQRARQSKEFAQIACEDMVKMSWLRTTRPPITIHFSIDGDPGDLHRKIVENTVSDWSAVDDDLVKSVEPIFQGIVKTALEALEGKTESSQMNNVVMEKYVYSESTRSITSYIRLLSFEWHKTVYHVIRGKEQERQTRVNLDVSLCLYEAIFEAALWELFSATLHDDETDLLWDYINGQTIDVRGSR
ncbi:hypothetical protein LZ32DRAFT_658111 [Colletotrichum eremochloae]|nr:hypothetical protein LZ32DRAFT_658111 [Colletotrichum eremochloae]